VEDLVGDLEMTVEALETSETVEMIVEMIEVMIEGMIEAMIEDIKEVEIAEAALEAVRIITGEDFVEAEDKMTESKVEMMVAVFEGEGVVSGETETVVALEVEMADHVDLIEEIAGDLEETVEIETIEAEIEMIEEETFLHAEVEPEMIHLEVAGEEEEHLVVMLKFEKAIGIARVAITIFRSAVNATLARLHVDLTVEAQVMEIHLEVVK